MDKPPVTETNFRHGPNVVQIGDLRVARGKTRRPRSRCEHLSMVFDKTERRVWCTDCEQEVDPFDAFTALVGHYSDVWEDMERRAQAVAEAESFTVRRRATKALDKVWRGKMVPCCVNCGAGMLPEDYVIVSQMSRQFAEKQKRRNEADK